MKKLRILGFSVLLLALVFASCGEDSGGGGSDTWSDVTNISQLNGTWRGSLSETDSIRNWSGGTWTQEDQELFGNMTVKMDIEMIYIINSSAGTEAGSTTMTMTFSGGNINDLWPMFKEEFDEPGVTFNDSRHSISLTENFGPQSFDESDFEGAQINQNGTKVRVSAEEMGFGGSEFIIFTKQ